MWDNLTVEGAGSTKLAEETLSARQSLFRTEPTKLPTPPAMSVCREILERPRPGQSLRPGRVRGFPASIRPLTENPPKIFPMGVSEASRAGGAEGGASGRYGLRASRGVGLRGQPLSSPCHAAGPPLGISGATRWHPVPRRRICAAAELALLPSWGDGGSTHRPARRRSFLELPV